MRESSSYFYLSFYWGSKLNGVEQSLDQIGDMNINALLQHLRRVIKAQGDQIEVSY